MNPFSLDNFPAEDESPEAPAQIPGTEPVQVAPQPQGQAQLPIPPSVPEQMAPQPQAVPQIRKLDIGQPPMKSHEQFDLEQFPTEDQAPEAPAQVGAAEPTESGLKQAARAGLQVPLGYASKWTWPIDVAKAFAKRYALSDLPELLEGVPEDQRDTVKQQFLEGIDKGASYIPDQSSAEAYIEQKTGLPLVPKSSLDKLIRLGSTAAGFKGGGVASKASAAAIAPTISGTAQAFGTPEWVADLMGLGATAVPGLVNAARPGTKAAALEKGLIGEQLPKSTFETAESALKELQGGEKPRFTRELPGAPQAGEGLSNRTITPGGQDVGVRPQAHTPLELNEQVTQIFSPNKFRNASEAGVANVGEIRTLDEAAYRGVNELYNRSRQLNSEVGAIQPQMHSAIDTMVAQIERIPHPSDIQNRFVRAARHIQNSLVDAEGRFIPISNQALIDQMQSLRSIVDYDFAHGGAKSIFKPLIGELDSAIMGTARQAQNMEAVAANYEARQAYSNWARTFDNDYVRPFRDTTNHDYIKLSKSLENPDTFNQVSHVLDISPRGQELAAANRATIVDQKLAKFMENPRNVVPKQFDQALRDLETVAGVTPEQISQIRTTFDEARRAPFRAAKPQPTHAERMAAKYSGTSPEGVQKLLDSRSGIRQLREDLSNSIVERKNFDTLTKQKMRSVLREGNVEKEFTGDNLYKLLNKEQNFEIFSEIIGEEATEAARQTAKEFGKRQLKIEAVKKLGGKAGTLKFLHTIYPLII